ncbi:hypothetical protein RIF29_34892 [Crotalaria pallida]|uniref:Uncharacterized protein n=1 Tax=Crotalaria pallida TaxID=3830 RepID=A0AAN9EF47_CROPI
MKGTSKVIMGATLVMVVTLALVLGLILVLLAELYCSLLLRRRRHLRNTIPTTTTTRANASPSHTSQSHPQQHPPPLPPFSSIYSQGVLQAPRTLLSPPLALKEENPLQGSANASGNVIVNPDKPCSGGEHLVYISNPIYGSDGSNVSGENTPFETPDTSPTRLERNGSSGEDDMVPASPCGNHSHPHTPTLTPMKKLPAEACSVSVSLRDARSLGTSCSDSHTNNGVTSSSSGSPCTSPSW